MKKLKQYLSSLKHLNMSNNALKTINNDAFNLPQLKVKFYSFLLFLLLFFISVFLYPPKIKFLT